MEYRFRAASGNNHEYCRKIETAGFEVKYDDETDKYVVDIYELQDLETILNAIGEQVIMDYTWRYFLIYDDYVE